jgi:hypothetical protein
VRPTDCGDTNLDVRNWSGLDSGQVVDDGLVDGTRYFYAACSEQGGVRSSSVRVDDVVPTAAIDTTPPGRVRSVRVKASAISVTVRWKDPADADFAGTVVVRRVGRQPRNLGDGTQVYDGSAQQTRDSPPPARRVWYAAFAVDDQGNAAAAATARIFYNPPLRFPSHGAVVRRRPTLIWRPVRGAAYYDVQLYEGTCCRRQIFDRHPRRASQPTGQLRRGRFYNWYVWANVRGKFRALGHRTFRVA